MVSKKCNRTHTSKSSGFDVSQLLVQPTIGLNRAARSAANWFTAVMAVWLFGFLHYAKYTTSIIMSSDVMNLRGLRVDTDTFNSSIKG